MRRTVLTTAVLLAVAATPAAAVDLGRWLPSLDLPAWPRIEAPGSGLPTAPAVPDPDAPAGSSADAAPGAPAETDAASPPLPQEVDPTLAGADTREPRRARPRGWRGLLPGSLK